MYIYTYHPRTRKGGGKIYLLSYLYNSTRERMKGAICSISMHTQERTTYLAIVHICTHACLRSGVSLLHLLSLAFLVLEFRRLLFWHLRV